MNVLLLGAGGQLGWELRRTCPDSVNLNTPGPSRIDLLNPQSITDCFKATLPDAVINAAAYTDVDGAETDSEKAFRINHLAVSDIVRLCRAQHTRLIHISTDFIFDGTSCKPYLPSDSANPLSVYGRSKLKGEQAIKKLPEDQALVLRTAWLYSSHGVNFVKTMLGLMHEKESLNVIDEQIGSPTWANGLAKAIWSAIEQKLCGIHHWTDAGVASWYDFATAIQEESIHIGLLKKPIPIYPAPVSSFPTTAKRPFYSVLDKTGLWQALHVRPVHWRTQLRTMLKELVE